MDKLITKLESLKDIEYLKKAISDELDRTVPVITGFLKRSKIVGKDYINYTAYYKDTVHFNPRSRGYLWRTRSVINILSSDIISRNVKNKLK